jgi:hypothetical protein
MKMSAAISGKVIALTGTFNKLPRAQIEAQLTALGAIIGKSLTRKTDLLIYGDKAGSKLSQAQSYGVATQDEAWLMDILAGGDGSTAARVALTGPLSDYIERLDAYAAALRATPGVKVGYTRMPGASPDRLDKLAQAWGLTSFSPAIRNLYQQADGLCLFWADTNHPEYKDQWDPSGRYYKLHFLDHIARGPVPMMERSPMTSEIESFPWTTGGIIWLLPAADAFKRHEGYYNFAYNVIPEDEEEVVYGRTWRGEQLQRAIRVFEASLQYYPVGFLMDPPQADPPVIVGDDHGACWTDCRFASFEDYMEGLLNQNFTLAFRRSLLCGSSRREVVPFERPAPEPISALLHAPPETPAVEGGNFTLTVDAVEPCDKLNARALLLQTQYASRFVQLKDILRLSHSSQDKPGFALVLADATQDLKAIDANTAARICSCLYLKTKTKKAAAEALHVDFDAAVERVTVTVKTRFDVNPFSDHKHVIATAAEQVVREQLGQGNDLIAVLAHDLTGRKELSISFDLLIAPGHGHTPGDTRASDIAPKHPQAT